MAPLSRRALLATAATGTAGALAGCGSLLNSSPSPSAPSVRGIDGRPLFVADGVTFPDAAGRDRSFVDDPSDADVAVFPPGDEHVEAVAGALEADTPVAVAGSDAQGTLMRSCGESARSYGFARDSWSPSTRVVAAVPDGPRLHTHLFVGPELPRDLPWALGELFDPAGRECTVPVDEPAVPDAATAIGTARIRGRNDVGGFDRRDRVRVSDDASPTSVFVDTEATIFAGSRGDDGGAYRADRVRIAADFEQDVADAGPGTTDANGLGVTHAVGSNGSDATSVDHSFTPETTETRESFTACTRTRVTVEEFADRFSYLANARFRWRDPQLLEDDTWVHHTPGSAVWVP